VKGLDRNGVYVSFARLVTYVLYGEAVKQCFLNAEWSLQGIIVFIALLMTVIRYFLANNLLECGYAKYMKEGKVRDFFGFWLNVGQAGTASLAARYQGEGRLICFLLALVAVDSIWAVYAWSGLREKTNATRTVIRSRMALNIVAAGFFLLVFSMSPTHHLAGVPLPPDVARLTVTALMVVSLVDFILNSRFYWLE